ncbi:MAG TPA: hypothetical protein V6D07_06485 [Trichocoleus sp.]
MGLLLLLLSVTIAQIVFGLIDGLPHLSNLVILPFRWLMFVGVIALLTWVSGE